MLATSYAGAVALVLAFATVGGTQRAKVPGSSMEVSIDLPDYRPLEAKPGAKREPPAKSGGRSELLSGHLGPVERQVVVEVEAVPSQPTKSSAQWRDESLGKRGDESKRGDFDCGDVKCNESRTEQPALHATQIDYHAFPVAGEWAFDLHVLVLEFGKPVFAREDFLAIVRSFKTSGTDLGSRNEWYPPAVAAFRDEAQKHGAGATAWVEEQCKLRRDDYVPHFFLGELAFLEEDMPRALRGYTRASELLQAKPDPTREEQFALGVSEDGLTIVFLSTKKHSQALPHAKKALEIAVALGLVPEQGERAYNLACTYGRSSDVLNAVKFLKQAIAVDAKYKDMAKQDEDFQAIRRSSEFKRLLGS